MFRGALTPDLIEALASGDRTAKLTGDNVVHCLLDPKAGDVLAAELEEITGPVSFEAWIQPAGREAGRIFDNLTAGQRDGFLIDCWPDLNVRVIVGPQQKDHPGALKAGVWQHIAVVLGRNRMDVYVNGEKR